MRIWDINPGYLNDQSLLGEHRELHAIVSILSNNKKGYSKHPETLRWKGYGWALRQRHKLLKAEMSLRGFKDKTPVSLRSNKNKWPDIYIDEPDIQYNLIKDKYKKKVQGRIPLPKNTQVLWAQHKYSVLARDPNLYESIGKLVVKSNNSELFQELSAEFTDVLRTSPLPGRMLNALQHMWGYVSEYSSKKKEIDSQNINRILMEIQQLSIKHNISYLLHSTSLSELGAWI